MSNTQTTETVNSTLQNRAPLERTLAVFDDETDALVFEYPFNSFDLESFKRHFDVKDEVDPLMYDVYLYGSSTKKWIGDQCKMTVAEKF